MFYYLYNYYYYSYLDFLHLGTLLHFFVAQHKILSTYFSLKTKDIH